MADENAYSEATKNPIQSMGYPGSGAPPPMGYAPRQPQYMQQPYAQGHMVVPIVFQSVEASQICDWLPWSIVNFFIGFIGGGILPLIFSLICRSNKQVNNVQGARTMSTLALVFNILVTIGGLAAWIYIIIFIVIISKALSPICSTYPYCP